MHSTVAHHPGADGPSDPEQQPPASFPLVYVLSLTPYGMEYPSGQLGPAVPVLPHPCFLCPYWWGSTQGAESL